MYDHQWKGGRALGLFSLILALVTMAFQRGDERPCVIKMMMTWQTSPGIACADRAEIVKWKLKQFL